MRFNVIQIASATAIALLITGCAEWAAKDKYSYGENYTLGSDNVFVDIKKIEDDKADDILKYVVFSNFSQIKSELNLDPNIDFEHQININRSKLHLSVIGRETKIFRGGNYGNFTFGRTVFYSPQPVEEDANFAPIKNCLLRFKNVHTLRFPVEGQYREQRWCQHKSFPNDAKRHQRFLRSDWYYFGDVDDWYRVGAVMINCFIPNTGAGSKFVRNRAIPLPVHRHLCGKFKRPAKSG